jgi:hypothetical protein
MNRLLLLFTFLILLTTSCLKNKKPKERRCGLSEKSTEQGFCGTVGGQSETFDNECAKCHHFSKSSPGPSMQSAVDHLKLNEFKLYFLKQDSLVKIGNERSILNKKEWNSQFNHSFTHLTNEEVEEIINLMY